MTLAIDKGVRFEPSKRELYLATFIPKSDVIYRFSFVLTLNMKAASQLTEWVFLELSQEVQTNKNGLVDLTERNSEEDIFAFLSGVIWHLYEKMKSKRSISPDSLPLVKILAELDDKERFILMASDIFELKIPLITKILKSDDNVVKKKLLKCREHLLVG